MSWDQPETPARTKVEAPRKTTNIIVQYRTKHGKLYELQGKSGVLSICIGYASEAGPPIHVEAHSDSSGCTVQGEASTPAAALNEVVQKWSSVRPPLPAFDWEAVARELREVRAL